MARFDLTNVEWIIAPLLPGAEGKLDDRKVLNGHLLHPADGFRGRVHELVPTLFDVIECKEASC
jgi:hypothetical protein